ncbi:hypothetical protein [Mesorhizobium sp. M4B.F.Ca.ET.017.02.2.1]|uniref:hypothetical protein n=1 Tax=Mesorhizobium sp. M4B.F.Ca.ET.017.02.2.1 TaxID=2496649 RepID=UPI0016791AD5|nr:hypothetical protein [Mesorhizobium sp. M4B.F.Ca.ET.017.02.2.1]
MERIFDELIGLQMKAGTPVASHGNRVGAPITSSLATGLAIGVGIAFGLVLAG